MNEERDVKQWLIDIVKSCTNSLQMQCCNAMIFRYKELNGNEADYVELKDTYNVHWNLIHGIIIQTNQSI